MACDAVRALGDVSDSNRDQLLGLLVERTVREHLPTELLKGVVYARRQLLTPLGNATPGCG
jgi:hypothetical protein